MTPGDYVAIGELVVTGVLLLMILCRAYMR